MPERPPLADDPFIGHPTDAQQFGGPWSLIKTDVVEKYLKFFNTALKNSQFKRTYIDAFAGSGAFQYVANEPIATLFGQLEQDTGLHHGSAQRALVVKPAFDQIIFIEENKSNVESLKRLITQTGHKAARVEQGDANEVLRKICQPNLWRQRRGVVFLDPFGMSVEWATLKLIAETKALDVWFLFALAGTVRNLPRLSSSLDASKRAAVTRVLGTDDWFGKFYQPQATLPKDLFGEPEGSPILRRTATVNQIEAYVCQRLRTIFAHVEGPKRLRGPRNTSLFSLFFAISNPAQSAVDLARKGASHILKNA